MRIFQGIRDLEIVRRHDHDRCAVLGNTDRFLDLKIFFLCLKFNNAGRLQTLNIFIRTAIKARHFIPIDLNRDIIDPKPGQHTDQMLNRINKGFFILQSRVAPRFSAADNIHIPQLHHRMARQVNAHKTNAFMGLSRLKNHIHRMPGMQPLALKSDFFCNCLLLEHHFNFSSSNLIFSSKSASFSIYFGRRLTIPIS